MLKLCINSRDELFVLDLDKVAYIQASGNYSRIVYIGGMQMMITLGLSKLEEMIKMIVPKDRRIPFVRLGRSLLVNQTYLTHINVLKQRLTLSDNQEHSYVLDVPKALLKAYKDLIRKSFAERIKNKEE
uniref:LytTR family transcriptional regulator DNA-binding domain-containing protein n=1 Tax=Candidatus Limisoma sp. TaxID=3076476 RepID=UPI0040287B3C